MAGFYKTIRFFPDDKHDKRNHRKTQEEVLEEAAKG